MDIVTNSSRKDAPSSLVRAVLRIGSWVIRFTFSFQFNIFCWSSDLKYEPTDEDHKTAKDKTLAVEDIGKLAIIWVDLKR